MSKTKIIIIQLKEIIYTAIFVGLGILLILLLVFMFLPKKDAEKTSNKEQTYKAGVYTSQLTLNNTTLNLEVTIDTDQIKSVKIANIDESITTFFPLLKPALEQIEAQLCKGADINNLKLTKDSKFTQTLLIDSIKLALNKARINE